MDYIVVTLVLCGTFSAYVAARKGRSPLAWWFVGALLPIVGPVLSLAVPAKAARSSQESSAREAPVPTSPPRRPKRCCGCYIPDCCGCPYFRRQLFDMARTGRSKGRCEFFGKDLEETTENAGSQAAGGER